MANSFDYYGYNLRTHLPLLPKLQVTRDGVQATRQEKLSPKTVPRVTSNTPAERDSSLCSPPVALILLGEQRQDVYDPEG